MPMRPIATIVRACSMPVYGLFLCVAICAVLCGTSIPLSAETTTYTYDINGQVTKVEYPNGTVITYTYDKMGNRQSRITSSVAATQPPTVSTGSATGVTGTGATLNATVNAHDHDTTVTFEYGLTTAYGASVPASQNPVTGSSSKVVSSTINGLSSGAVYHYRAVGISSAGTAAGSDKTFVTSGGELPTVTTDNATGITGSGATLNATVNARNNDTAVIFEYGPTTAYGTTMPASQNPVTGSTATAVSRSITGLNPGILYHYRAVGFSAVGTVSGSDKTFTTTGASAGLVINGGAVYTVNPKVTLTIGAYPGGSRMQLNYTAKGWGKIENFAASKIISLPKGDGLKNVSVRYLDTNGTALGESSAVIVLDTKTPTGFVVINGGAKLTNSRDLIMAIVASDITSGLATLCIREDKLPCGNGEYTPYVPTKEYTLASAGDGKKTVYVTLRDQAGKTSKQLKASITLDTLAPTGSVVINSDKAITLSPLVVLKLKAVKASEMKLSLDGGTAWSEWMKFAGSKKVTLPPGAGEKVVKAKFRDLAGNVSEGCQDSITLQ